MPKPGEEQSYNIIQLPADILLLILSILAADRNTIFSLLLTNKFFCNFVLEEKISDILKYTSSETLCQMAILPVSEVKQYLYSPFTLLQRKFQQQFEKRYPGVSLKIADIPKPPKKILGFWQGYTCDLNILWDYLQYRFSEGDFKNKEDISDILDGLCKVKTEGKMRLWHLLCRHCPSDKVQSFLEAIANCELSNPYKIFEESLFYQIMRYLIENKTQAALLLPMIDFLVKKNNFYFWQKCVILLLTPTAEGTSGFGMALVKAVRPEALKQFLLVILNQIAPINVVPLLAEWYPILRKMPEEELAIIRYELQRADGSFYKAQSTRGLGCSLLEFIVASFDPNKPQQFIDALRIFKIEFLRKYSNKGQTILHFLFKRMQEIIKNTPKNSTDKLVWILKMVELKFGLLTKVGNIVEILKERIFLNDSAFITVVSQALKAIDENFYQQNIQNILEQPAVETKMGLG